MRVKMFMLAGLALMILGLGIGNSVAQAPDWEWVKIFGGRGNDAGFSVQQTSDGGYILLGETFFLGSEGREFLLIKSRP
ncbi:MAG: hypothetical protein K6T71_00715 [Candidatus Bipolaricaulota bacterium]|nr:hypothetical protein [Candidatus Bipolaricaulota bacterium]